MSLNWSPGQWLIFHQYGHSYDRLNEEDKEFWRELNRQYEAALLRQYPLPTPAQKPSDDGEDK